MDDQSLGPREAADAIRSEIAAGASSRLDPEHAHGIVFIKEVCGFLGLEPTVENVILVEVTLRKNHIALHAGNEYPKWVGEGGDAVIVNSREEEDKFNDKGKDAVDDEHEEQDYEASLFDETGTKAPTYEPFAGSTEPGAPNRPTEPAPVASPVSDNNFGDRPDPKSPPFVEENPNATPNPQPGDPTRPTLDKIGSTAPAPPRRPK